MHTLSWWLHLYWKQTLRVRVSETIQGPEYQLQTALTGNKEMIELTAVSHTALFCNRSLQPVQYCDTSKAWKSFIDVKQDAYRDFAVVS